MSAVLVQWIFSALFSFTHPFFVSVIQIDHNQKDKTLEISVRVFTDDLENTLRTANPKVDLINGKDKAENDRLIYAYFQKHLKLSVNGKPVSFQYVGHERQSESVWSYLEVTNVSDVKKLDVVTDLLYEFTNKQENIIQVKANGKKDSYRLDFPKNSTSFLF